MLGVSLRPVEVSLRDMAAAAVRRQSSKGLGHEKHENHTDDWCLPGWAWQKKSRALRRDDFFKKKNMILMILIESGGV